MTSGAQLAPAQAGELRADGNLIVKREEKPNGWVEIRRMGKLKIRGESKSRSIQYADYAKLASFYSSQERLIKDRKHIMVALADGTIVNTADITSLELTDEETFVPKVAQVSDALRSLPTAELLLSMDGKIIGTTVTKAAAKATAATVGNFLIANCHYKMTAEGKRAYATKLEQIPEAHEMRPSDDPDYDPTIAQIYKYGIPQL